MRFSSMAALVTGAFVVHAVSPDATTTTTNDFNTFRSQHQNNTMLRYVANSGICETPSVNQYSGCIHVGKNMSMWFWFFEARQSPETAPFTLWLNGGPGCSSMIGLFTENGPCQVNEDGKTMSLNPYSWNNVSNMLYIDQPISRGFSYGTDTLTSTENSATFVWKAFQILFESKLFSKYASRESIFATESYGGHYGPSFVSYFDHQNALIANGAIKGERIVVSALLIINGFIDPKIQDESYYKFAANAPGYGPLQPDSVLKNISKALHESGGCVAQEEACYAAGRTTKSNAICRQADDFCSTNVFLPAIGDRDPYDLQQKFPGQFPYKYYLNYLEIPEVLKRIGAETAYQECSDHPYDLFTKTGDNGRSWLPELFKLANSRLRISLLAGDADIMCNWLGCYDCALAMDWYGKECFRNTPLSNITLDGTVVAAVANVDNFSFARIFAAGHKVPAYKPAAALEILSQIIRKESLHSV